MPRKPYGRRQVRSELRATRVLDLWANKRLSYREIAEQTGYSKQWVGHLVRAALARQQRERERLGLLVKDVELERLDTILRQCDQIACRECPRCYGHGTRNSKLCTRCGGEGYWYGEPERGRAMDRIVRVTEQRAKLLGLYAPQDHRLIGRDGQPYEFGQRAVSRMADEELEEQLQNFLVAQAQLRDTDHDADPPLPGTVLVHEPGADGTGADTRAAQGSPRPHGGDGVEGYESGGGGGREGGGAPGSNGAEPGEYIDGVRVRDS